MNLSNLNWRHKAGLFLILVTTGLSLLFEATTKQSVGILLLGLALTWLLGSLSVRALRIVASVIVCAVGLIVAIVPVQSDWESFRIRSQDYDEAIADLRKAVAIAPQGTVTFDPDEFMRHRYAPETLPPDFFDRKRTGPAPPPPGFTLDTAGSKVGKKKTDDQLYDTTRVDVVEHACLGTLKFPHDMLYEERNRLTDELEKKSCKMVDIPTSTQKWELPPNEFGFLLTGIPFPNNATDEEIVSSIQAKELRPRPSFSVKAAIATHRVPFFLGMALSTLGLFGCTWLIWGPRRAI